MSRVVASLMGAVMVITGQLSFGISPAAADDTHAPLAVFIVGPSASMTDDNLRDAAALAKQADDIGMRVRKVFHPHATWENVLDAIQGASLVVYMGHGNGYPSPNGPFQEDTKDGFGLDPHPGASAYSTAYYGADKLRKKVRLAKNAVVLLEHLCYASGNGEEYMGPEFDKDIATKRVDNFASGFLDIGARAVFAFGLDQKIDFPRALMRGDRSMDDIFEAPNSDRRYDGFVGSKDYYRDSRRTGWARIHMDPHPREGHYRALTGDLAMTASEFRAGAGELSSGFGSGPDNKAPVLKVQGSGAGLAATVRTIQFSPNGDHTHDSMRVGWTLTERASIRVVIRNRHDDVVRSYTRSGRRGHGTITWDGRNDAGKLVGDGTYHVTLTPRDKSGNKGTERTVNALVLTSVKSTSQSRTSIFTADRDQFARSTRIAFTLTRRARVTWSIQDSSGHTVVTHASGKSMAKGRHAWSWDGRDRKGRFVKSGDYQAVISVRTSAGTVRMTRKIHVGAFRISTSDSTPKRGQKIRIRVYSTEPLKSAPRIRVSQPGQHDRVLGTKRVGSAYMATITLRRSGKAGSLRIAALGTDKGGSRQSFTQVLHLH
jgi:flagellar hook assembly protein FlgD